MSKDIEELIELNDELLEKAKEIERLNNTIKRTIHCINLLQHSKTGHLEYEDIKIVRGILQNDEFYNRLFDNKLKELKEKENE